MRHEKKQERMTPNIRKKWSICTFFENTQMLDVLGKDFKSVIINM